MKLNIDDLIEDSLMPIFFDIKNVTSNEPFFERHFPGNPVMPGVILIEALAQVGGILVMNSINDPKNHIPYLAGVENFRFRKNFKTFERIKYL